MKKSFEKFFQFLTAISCIDSPQSFVLSKNGGTAVEAVEESVSILEDCELFKAGRGSELTANGEVECDAMIMEGHTLKTG